MAGSRNRLSADPLAVVLDVLQRHVVPRSRLCVGLSGGVDSVALLHLLKALQGRLDFALDAIHVNHQISPNAGRWADFCRDLCCQWDIPLLQRRVSIGDARRDGLEASARAARYREFAAADADFIVLAHHRDDQAETVLLNQLRGTGVRGLAAMPEIRPVRGSDRLLLRPLLGLARREIEAYARAQGLAWIEDESNADVGLRRNFLRREILPQLDPHFPGCREALARTAGWAAESAMLLDQLAEIDASHCLDAALRLDLTAFRRLRPERARNLLRYWLRNRGLRMPDSERLDAMMEQLCGAAAQTAVRLDLEGGAVRSYRGWATIEPATLDGGLSIVEWHGEESIRWNGGQVAFRMSVGDGVSRAAVASRRLVLRVRRGGERMQLDARRPHRTLKNLCQEAGIPPWLRRVMPLLWCGEDLVWVPGLGVAADYRCTPDEPGITASWELEASPPLRAD